MVMINRLRIISLFLFVALGQGDAYTADKVIAVVEDEVVLLSEVRELLSQYEANQIDLGAHPESLILENLIDEKVMLAQAKRESLSLDDNEVKKQVDKRIAQLKSQVPGGIAGLEKALSDKYGISLADYRRKQTEGIRSQMFKMQLRNKHFPPQKPSKKEVEEFYERYQDSLRPQDNSIALSHIMIKIVPSQERDSLARRTIDSVLSYLKSNKEDFEKLAQTVSDDPSGAEGGDLGWFGKGTLDPSFERAAYGLRVGEISGRVKSRFGYHVILLIDKDDRRIHCRHILAMVTPSTADTARAAALSDSIFTLTQNNGDFSKLAGEFSDDAETRRKGGFLGWLPYDQVQKEYRDLMDKMKPGEVHPVYQIAGAFHILKLVDRQDKRKLTLDEDWEIIAGQSELYLGKKRLERLLKEWRQNVYIENRLADKKHPGS